MGTVRKAITLTDKQDARIKAQIDSGNYTNDSAYIRDLIRREQERSAETEAIRASLIEGEASGGANIVRCCRIQAANVGRIWVNTALHPPPSAIPRQSGFIPCSGGVLSRPIVTSTP